MPDDFDPSNAVAVHESPEGNKPAEGDFNVDNAVPVESSDTGQTPYDSFRTVPNASTSQLEAQNKPDQGKIGSLGKDDSKGPLNAKEGQLEGISPTGKKYKTEMGPTHQEYPDEGLLNSVVHTAEGAAWNLIAKPIFGMKDPEVDKYLSDIQKQHPIAATLTGVAPYIVTAPLFPEGLIGISSQFATVSGLGAVGKARTEESLKPIGNKVLDVVEETAKGASFGPIWHYSASLGWLGRAFTRGVGTGTLTSIYGDNITESFKQGGVVTALSLIFENPYLAKTALGRGVIEKANTHIYESLFGSEIASKIAQTSKPVKIDVNGKPEQIKSSILDFVNAISKRIFLGPKIVAATVQLTDGTHVHGTSHDDALSKIGASTETMKETNLPKVSLKADENLPANKDVINKSGESVGKVSFSKEHMEEEGLSIDIKETLHGKGYGKAAIGEVFASGVQHISGDVGKDNTKAQKFWKSIGAELTPTSDGNFKVNLSKEGFESSYQGKYEAGFTVMDPDGTTHFITSQESKKPPFNLPNGYSKDVKGLNESKFMAQPEPLKIVNPETLKFVGDESGQMNVNMIPGVTETAEVLSRSTAELKEKLRPYSVGQEGKFTAEVLREQLGIVARANDKTEQALAQAKKFFDKATKESITETYTKAERGEKQDSPELQKIYDTLQGLLKEEADNVRALGTGKLEQAIENYLPHVWESPKKAASILGQIFGRRPFEGPKSFLKKRSINDFAEGIEAGLTPVSWNPVDLTMLKLREMRKYVMAQRTKEALKEQGLRKFVKVGQKVPDGWKKINDNAEDVYKSPMIAIQEAFDEHVMTKLNEVAKNLGIDLERKVTQRGRELGSSQRGPAAEQDPADLITGKAQPGKIKTKFASPESVLAHEIGHQIDEMFGLKQQFLSDRNNLIIDKLIEKTKKNESMSDVERKDAIDKLKFEKKLNKEFQQLADLRFEGKEVDKGFKQYVRKGSEKMAVMLEAYIHAPEKFKEAAPNVFKSFDYMLKTTPELAPLTQIKPSLVLGTAEGEVYAGGNVISGHYYTQPDAARIIDNHLSPGLVGKSYMYDLYRGAGNTLNQFQLGLSAFHLGFTSMDATISKFALGINKLSTGNFAGAIKEFGAAPFAPVTNIMQGRELLQAWYGKDKGELTNTIADMMASAGGRAKMDKFYATGAKESMQKALKEGKILTGAMKVPFYIVEQVARPIMEYIVPRQKMGVFMDMMKMEMERNPNISHEQLRGIAQKAWDSVDNRMGQLVYDNLFWNRTVKDLGMASVRSLGWNLGTIREVGGGVKDVIGNVNDVIHGRGTKVSYRTAYVMALPIVTGLYGAIYQYLHTGQGPQELKDYFFPKNGAIDNKGQEARISFPTYMKDLYHYRTNPVQTVVNKFSPVNNIVLEMLANKDFYGTEIRNMDDPIMQQVLDEAKFIGTQFLPFGFRNQKRDTRTSLGSKIEPFIGLTPAPYDVNMTKAERVASEINREKGKFTRSKEQAQHAQDKAKLRSEFMASKDTAPLTEAVSKKVITSREKQQIIKESKMSRLERATQHLSFEEVQHVYKAATEEEKPELQKIIERKRRNKKQAGTWTSQEEKMYDQSFNSSE